MDYVHSLQCGWFAVHILGLVAAVTMRISAGTRAEAPLQALFLGCLAAVAVVALASRQFCWPLSTFSAGTLAVMIVFAVADLGGRRAEALSEAV